MNLIDVLIEIERLIIRPLKPQYLRFDPLPQQILLSSGNRQSDYYVSVVLQGTIEGFDNSFVLCSPKQISLILGSCTNPAEDLTAVIVSEKNQKRLTISNSEESKTNIALLPGDIFYDDYPAVRPPTGPNELAFDVSAEWKRLFDYWVKWREEVDAADTFTLFPEERRLRCTIGNKIFDHHTWQIPSSSDFDYLSSISFECSAFSKALSLYGRVDRMSVLIYRERGIVVRSRIPTGRCDLIIPARVTHAYQAAYGAQYEQDDPRSVFQQRWDGD